MNKILLFLASSSLLCASTQNAHMKEYNVPLKTGKCYIDIAGGPLNLKDSTDNLFFNHSFFSLGINYRLYPKRLGIKKAMEYGMDLYPNITGWMDNNESIIHVEWKAGLIHYFAPDMNNGNYIIGGVGASTYRYYFTYAAFGREFDRLSAISKKIELNISATPTSTSFSLFGSPKTSGTHGNRIKLILGMGF
ncbi:MAG: hypothetical protein SP4CHLAM5_03660 [Chlamydiia bacterium]|nr:hypothetical protein [Chlamydiia bacterium]MCH9618240.1 hypothetical protein [Chlamydiia bacterium]MCH9624305.1 hypothetical protein [Chlamydiia bacterium]